MDKYQDYGVKDFVTNDYFISWVFGADEKSNHFWQTWIAEHPQKSALIDQARNLLQTTVIKPLDVQLSDQEVHHLVHQVVSKQRNFKNNNWIYPWFSVAAAILVICSWWFFSQKTVSIKPDTVVQVLTKKVTNRGSNSQIIQLTDGSLVLLKPQSTLEFPSKFDQTRKVFLKGAAFFEVKRDTLHPFLVNTGSLVVKVLGTSFDVDAPGMDKQASVIVKTGKVQVFHIKDHQAGSPHLDSVILTPNQKAIYHVDMIKLRKISIPKPLMLSPAQADKLFTFNNAPLSEIIDNLQQAYGISISCDEEKFKDYTVTASLSKLPLEEKIRAICKAIDANYEFQSDQIKIY